jgi:hypothetical protein
VSRGKRPSRNYIESLLSPTEAGKIMGVSGQWIAQMCRAGTLLGYKTPLGWLIDPDDLKRAAAKRAEKMRRASIDAAAFADGFYERYGETMSELAKR